MELPVSLGNKIFETKSCNDTFNINRPREDMAGGVEVVDTNSTIFNELTLSVIKSPSMKMPDAKVIVLMRDAGCGMEELFFLRPLLQKSTT